MSLLMQALRRAELAKKAQAGADVPAGAATEPKKPVRVGPELTLELKEPNADERAAAAAQVTAAQEREDGSSAAAPQSASDADHRTHAIDSAPPQAPSPTPPVDYFSVGEPPSRPVFAAAPTASASDIGELARTAASPPPAPDPVPEPVAPIAPPVAARIRESSPQEQALAAAALKEAQARGAAGALFAAKRGVPNRRALVMAAVGVLILAVAAVIFYFLVLRVAPSPLGLPPTGRVAVLVPVPAAEPIAVAPAVTPVPVPLALPVPVPVPVPVVPAPVASPAPPAAPVASARPARPTPARVEPTFGDEPPAVRVLQLPASRQRASAPVPAATVSAPIEVRRTEGARAVSPALAGAYQSFLAGDASAARSQYQRVLQQDPDNRDALLGMAAVAQKRAQADEAGAFYARLLELNPSDAEAVAGMASVQRGDPGQAESRLKGVLAASPDTGSALYALGNLYAQQARWSEAQQAYFRAVGTAPSNPAYAFNLAVSLDKLDQKNLALDYYRRALQLSAQGGGALDAATVSARIRQLEQAGAR